MSEHYHKHARKFHCERLGVEKQNVIDKNLESESIQLVSLSGIVPVKQIEFIIRTLAEWDGKKIEWHHIGSAKDQAYGLIIEQMAEEILKPKNNVSHKFHGFIKPEHVIAKLEELNPHFLINASTFEGIPVSMMEACSLGIPIIGPDVCGVPEIIEHRKNGYLFSPTSPEQLLSIFHEIENLEESEYQDLRVNALNMQRQRFNAATNYNHLAAILKGETKLG
ncbi:MAG: glycosyltransferase [Flavobacteriales bacterium]|nr:glycosyltransferase [Flavobacteriales bacterium]